jgi:hypothetical protein
MQMIQFIRIDAPPTLARFRDARYAVKPTLWSAAVVFYFIRVSGGSKG